MRNPVIPLLLIVFGLGSCQDVIELDLPDNPPLLIVNGRVTDSIPVEVQVFTTAPYYSTEVPTVPGARIILFENGIKVDSLIENVEGHYFGSFVGSVGNDYTLRVEIPDGNPALNPGIWVSEPETLKRCPPIDSLFSEYVQPQPFIREGYYVYAAMTEPAGIGDYYRVRAWRNDTLQNGPFDIQTFTDELYDGWRLRMMIDGPRPVGTTYKIELSSINRTLFDFLNLLRQQTGQVGSTFDAPPAAIVGNIHREGKPSDYALGYFNASSVSYAEVVITE